MAQIINNTWMELKTQVNSLSFSPFSSSSPENNINKKKKQTTKHHIHEQKKNPQSKKTNQQTQKERMKAQKTILRTQVLGIHKTILHSVSYSLGSYQLKDRCQTWAFSKQQPQQILFIFAFDLKV